MGDTSLSQLRSTLNKASLPELVIGRKQKVSRIESELYAVQLLIISLSLDPVDPHIIYPIEAAYVLELWKGIETRF